tara:strand:+ start:4244 stop:4369 length:126 start_codon:yes stop_codon:yes gene_type:complete
MVIKAFAASASGRKKKRFFIYPSFQTKKAALNIQKRLYKLV